MIKEFIKKNEENITTMVTIIIIVIAIIIITINWILVFVDFDTDESDINNYTAVSYEDVMSQQYSSEIITLLSTKNTDELYQRTDLNFLTDNNLTEENYKSYLLSNNLIGNEITIISESCFSSGNVYVFRYYYKNYSDYKYVNVIESMPGEYYISFEQELTSVDNISLCYSATLNDVTAEVSINDETENDIKLNLRITNNNVLSAQINFNDLNSFVLYGDEIYVTMSSVVAENVSEITSGSSVNRELCFTITSDDFSNCEGLKIKNVKINDEYFDIVINF